MFDEINAGSLSKLLAEIGPWMRRMKSLKQDTAFAVLAADLSHAGLHRRQSCNLVYHEPVWALLVQFT